MSEKLKILIIDDEEIILESLKKQIPSEDFELETANSVKVGMRLVESNYYDIILTDLMMPEIDGLQFIKMLKEKGIDSLIIMITGYATINTALQAMQAGAYDYLAKPFTKSEIRKLLSRAASSIRSNNSMEFKVTNNGIKNNEPSFSESAWLRKMPDGLITLGAERAFFLNIGTIQAVYLPDVGDEIRQGCVCFQAFSNDLRTEELISPISGTVVKVNNRIRQRPEAMLYDPYEDGWLMKIKPAETV